MNWRLDAAQQSAFPPLTPTLCQLQATIVIRCAHEAPQRACPLEFRPLLHPVLLTLLLTLFSALLTRLSYSVISEICAGTDARCE